MAPGTAATEGPGDTLPSSAEPLLTTREAAERLGVYERSVRRAIARGEIPASKEHGVYRIAAAAINRIASPHAAPKLVVLSPPPDRDGVVFVDLAGRRPATGGTTPLATAQASAQGHVRFANLPPGTYQLRPKGTV